MGSTYRPSRWVTMASCRALANGSEVSSFCMRAKSRSWATPNSPRMDASFADAESKISARAEIAWLIASTTPAGLGMAAVISANRALFACCSMSLRASTLAATRVPFTSSNSAGVSANPRSALSSGSLMSRAPPMLICGSFASSKRASAVSANKRRAPSMCWAGRRARAFSADGGNTVCRARRSSTLGNSSVLRAFSSIRQLSSATS